MKMRILVLEESTPEFENLCATLRLTSLQPEVKHVTTLDDALESLGSAQCDCVLMVQEMFCTNAPDAVLTIHSIIRDVPIIVLSDSGDTEFTVSAVGAGASDVIQRSLFEPERVELIIRCSLERASQLRESAERVTQLEHSLDLLSQLFDTTAHDFRTPLTVITEYASLLQEGVLGEVSQDQQEVLNVVADRTNDLANMVDDMLGSCRLEGQRLSTIRLPVSIDDIVGRVRPALDQKAELREVSLKWESPGNLPDVYCDPEQAGHVLRNLTTSAITTCSEKCEVCISFRRDPSTGEVKICVRTCGDGLEPEELRVISQGLDQPGTSTLCCPEGFGLDFAVARELADLNLGRLSVEMKADAGTEFSFTLPLMDQAELVRRYVQRLARLNAAPSLACFRAGITGVVERSEGDQIDAFWRYTLGGDDLALRRGDHDWILLIPMEFDGSVDFRRRIHKEHSNVSEKRVHGALPPISIESMGFFEMTDSPGIERTVRDDPITTEPAAFTAYVESSASSKNDLGVAEVVRLQTSEVSRVQLPSRTAVTTNQGLSR